MRNKHTQLASRGTLVVIILFAVALFNTGCGGGGGGNSAVAPALLEEPGTGTITGIIDTAATELGRVADRSAATQAGGVKVYALPADLQGLALVPDDVHPHAVTLEDGSFTINNIKKGKYVLLVDLDADGAADGLVIDVAVSNNQTTQIGKKCKADFTPVPETGTMPKTEPVKDNEAKPETNQVPQPETPSVTQPEPQPEIQTVPVDVHVEEHVVETVNEHETETPAAPAPQNLNYSRKGTWCDVLLNKVIYSTGETLVITLYGKNETAAPIKCGVKINLRKSKEHPEMWRSAFTDAATFVTIEPGTGSATVLKVIPETWPLTSTNKGSDYYVSPINETGAIIGKGDNFNILKKKACTDNCVPDPGTDPVPVPDPIPVPDPAPIPDPPPVVIACYTNVDCDDNFDLTLDICMNAGTTSAYCVNSDF